MDSTRKTASRTIQAIETQYAGCRFRSRLEARWAVFFDTLDIRWEYEPEGFQVSWRLDPWKEGTFPYLPDFWLPTLKFWVEVKGSLTQQECERLLNAAASLSSNNGGGCHDSGGYDMLVLGPIPEVSAVDGVIIATLPWRLHMHKGDVELTPWFPELHVKGSTCSLSGIGPAHQTVASDYGGTWENITQNSDLPVDRIPAILTEPGYATAFRFDSGYIAALMAARSARFEHGEQGR